MTAPASVYVAAAARPWFERRPGVHWKILFEDGAASIVDAAVSPTARVEIAGVRLTARDFSWPARAPIPVRLETPTPGAGTVTAHGSLDLTGRSLDLELHPAGVDLAPMQPYLPVRGQAAGKASGDLKLHATLDPLAITARSTASVAGLQAGFGPHVYSAAKAAVVHLTRSVAMELGESGVRVNCICPGGILTPILVPLGNPGADTRTQCTDY